jgi:hypothetical protein
LNSQSSPRGSGIVGGGPRGCSERHKTDIASHLVKGLAAVTWRTRASRVAGEQSFHSCGSRRRSPHQIRKFALLLWRQEVEKVQCRTQHLPWLAVVQVGSGQEICTDHLQAVAARLVAAEHERCGFDCLLDTGIRLL